MKVLMLRPARTLSEVLEKVSLQIQFDVNRAKIGIDTSCWHARMMIDKRAEECGLLTRGVYNAKVRLNCLYGKFAP